MTAAYMTLNHKLFKVMQKSNIQLINSNSDELNIQVLLNGSGEGRLRNSTNDALLLLPILEEEHSRYTSDAVIGCNVAGFICVQFVTCNLPCVFLRQLIDHRSDYLAWPAPWRPELHQHRDLAPQHLIIPA